MAKKLEYCTWCKADFTDANHWCSKCLDTKIKKRKKPKDDNQQELL